MAPKPRRKGPPPKGQRSITTFLGGSPGGSAGGDAALPPPTKRPRTASAAAGSQPLEKAQQEQEQPNGRQQAGPGPASTSDVATLQPSPALPRQPTLGGPASGYAREVLQRKLGVAGEAAAAAAGAQQAIEPGAGPGGAAAKLTPLEQQIVALKRRHPGVLLCVEVGYKFKFFGADAETASRELGIYAFQDRAFLTAGFPTHRLSHHVRRLVLAGHKVGVVRQVETAAIKKAGDNRSGPFERKLTALHSKATLEAGELGGLYDSDGEGGAGQEGGGEEGGGDAAAAPARPRRRRAEPPPAGPASYLVCCVEEAVGPGGGPPGQVEVGLVAVEPSTGAVLHTQFRDGLLRQELESRLLFAAPAEILVAEPASSETRRLAAAIGEQLSAPPRLETAAAAKYKLPGTAADAVRSFYGAPRSEGVGAEAGAAAEAVAGLPPLVLRALAHLLDHLRPFGLEGVLRLGAAFQPWDQAQEMRLSANTLRQLEVFRSSDGGPQGSLVGVMDHTKTKFGRRLMHSWVGKPLRRREAIEERLDAVQELVETGDSHPVLCRLVSTLRTLPDLERGLTRALHATVRPAELATLLQHLAGLGPQLGLGQAADGGSLAAAVETGAAEESSGEEAGGEEEEGGSPVQPPLNLQGVRSALLARLLRAAADSSVAAACRRMLAAMDLDAAAANDTANALRPNERYTDVLRWREEAAAAERALGELLPSFRAALQISTLQFVTLQNQGEYLVEVPADLVKRVPPSWEKISSVKKAVRYHPPEVKAGLQRLALAREHLKAACEAAWRSFLRGFGSRYLRLRAVVQALAALDCLCGLAVLAANHGYVRPELARHEEPPQVVIEGGRHPALELLLEGRGAAFVPNDTRLRGDGLRCQVVTGPNMGGKSCYSRQCALICIMAQVGSFVPAASARLRPLDAVLTRMGASDCLALGRSTFAEELGEASAIVSGATSSSLVILDELGRGTSTGDGAAIAEAVLSHVVQRVGALTLFITHYPEACFRLQAALPGVVACYRMAHVEEEGGVEETRLALAGQQHEEEAGDARPGQQGSAEEGEGEEGEAAAAEGRAARQRRMQASLGRVVFLFRLVEGVAPASYGINVARMAQLPPPVLARAAAVAERVQRESEARQRRQQLAQLAQRCRRFAAASEEAGRVDVEEGRRLQELARQLLDGTHI